MEKGEFEEGKGTKLGEEEFGNARWKRSNFNLIGVLIMTMLQSLFVSFGADFVIFTAF